MKYYSSRKITKRSFKNIGKFLVFVGILGLLTLLVVSLISYATDYTQRLTWKKQALNFWKSENYAHVLLLSENTLSRNPLDPNALFFSGAASYYLLAFGSTPEDHHNYLNRAILKLRTYINLKKSHVYIAEAHYILGKLYYNKGESYANLVIENLQKALALKYNNIDIPEYMGMAYVIRGEYETGIRYLNKVTAPPNDYSLKYNIAKAKESAEKFQEAKQLYLEIYEKSRNDHLRDQAYLRLAAIEHRNGQHENAKTIIKKFLKKYPSHSKAHFLLAKIYSAENNEKDARKEWGIVTRLDPSNTQALDKLHGGTF